MINFCNYCRCGDCVYGKPGLYHALTIDGDWICDVCWLYDMCTNDGPNRNRNGPCENRDCIHRPRIKGKWIKYVG